MRRASAGRSVAAVIPGVLSLLALATLVSADTPPYRGWRREGLDPLGPGEWYEDTTLPNGARVRVRAGPNGAKQVVAVAPETLRLSRAGESPDEKRYRQLVELGKVEDVAKLLDRVLTAPESGRILLRPPWESVTWVSARTLARTRLLALSAEGRAAYRTLRDEEAQARLETALHNGDPWDVEAVVDRYPAATLAANAAVAAGDLFLEQGELRAARRAWERARHDYATEVDLAAIASRIACALLLEGGREEKAHVRDDPARSAHAALGVAAPGRLRALWRRKIAAPAHGPSRIPSVLAVAHEDAAFIHEARGVTAIELDTGRVLWRTALEKFERPEWDEAPATVTVGDEAVVVVRGRRRAFLLDRSTGRVARTVDLKRDLGGAPIDRIDAAASDRGRLYVLATVAGDRIVAAFDQIGALVFRSDLWPGSGLDVSFLVGREGVYVLADGGLAALDPSGDVRWARPAEPLHLDPGRACERALLRAGATLILLAKDGLTVLDAGSGERRSMPPLPRGLLALAAGEEGPVFLNPAPPRGDPQVLALEKDHVLVVARLDERARPAWTGVLADGVVWIPGDRDLVALELASGDELGRCRFEGGPGRLSAAGGVVLSARDDEVAAYACRAAPPPPRALSDDPRELLDRLSARDWRERRAARDRLRALGSKAEPVLRAALEAPSAEARDAASELLPDIGLRDLWTKALQELAIDASASDLVAPDGAARLRGLRRAHGGDKDAQKPSESLRQALRTVLANDDEALVREEALSWLVARDADVRSRLEALILDGEAIVPGRAAAAEALINSRALDETSPAHSLFVRVLESPREEVRRAGYMALLRHGGPKERQFVADRLTPWKDKDGKEQQPDPWADASMRAFGREKHPRPGPMRDPAARSAERDDERRALLERVKLGE